MAERDESKDVEAAPESAADPIGLSVAMAVGVRKRRAGAKPDPEFDAFLRKHSRLIEVQTEHLQEQRGLTLARARLGRWKDRVTLTLQAMTAAAGLAAAVAIGAMAWAAHGDHGVAIEEFSVPIDFAQRGLTGQVVASIMLDDLGRMQDATVSARAPSSYANNWNDDIKIEIPETGVPIGELRRLLVRWLGHQTLISGEVYRTQAGLTFAARIGSAPATLRRGSDADLDSLVGQVAEEVYATTQPYRYAVYLRNEGRTEAARGAFQQLTLKGDPTDRLWAYVGLGNLYAEKLGDAARADSAYSAAIDLDPRFGIAYWDRGALFFLLDRDEAALADYKKASEAYRRFGPRYVRPAALANMKLQSEAGAARLTGDYATAVRDYEGAQANPDLVSESQAGAHDIAAARATAGQSAAMPESANPDALLAAVRSRRAEVLAIDRVQEDWPAYLRDYATFDQTKLSPYERLVVNIEWTPYAALAKAKMGDFSGAQSLAATTPLDCYHCVIARAQIAAVAGDWADADRWFGIAIQQAQSLPFAYLEWGRVLLERGDTDRSIAELEMGHLKGPRLADPLEVWGAALMRQRDYRGAIAKFVDADRCASKWGRNHLIWGEALMLSARYAEARTQYETADRLGLSKPDRAALDVLLASTSSGPLHG